MERIKRDTIEILLKGVKGIVNEDRDFEKVLIKLQKRLGVQLDMYRGIRDDEMPF